MRRVLVAGGTILMLVAATPASAQPASGNAKPRIVTATASAGPERSVTVTVVGRDRDDVVRGAEIVWGEAEPALGESACEVSSRRAERRQRGKRARFELTHAYAAPGHYTITVQVLSGGCGKRVQQRSAARTLTVHVD
jgi:hypothetical protein